MIVNAHCGGIVYSGIGAGIALRLARDGAKVVVNYNNSKKQADAVVAAINSVAGSGAIAVQVATIPCLHRAFAAHIHAYVAASLL